MIIIIIIIVLLIMKKFFYKVETFTLRFNPFYF